MTASIVFCNIRAGHLRRFNNLGGGFRYELYVPTMNRPPRHDLLSQGDFDRLELGRQVEAAGGWRSQ